jgi:hypothetical protein
MHLSLAGDYSTKWIFRFIGAREKCIPRYIKKKTAPSNHEMLMRSQEHPLFILLTEFHPKRQEKWGLNHLNPCAIRVIEHNDKAGSYNTGPSGSQFFAKSTILVPKYNRLKMYTTYNTIK